VHGDGVVTPENANVPASCAAPLDVPVLVDYWQGLLPAGAEAGVEEHLFSCDYCGDRLREVIDLSDGLRELARSGTLFVVINETLLQRAEAAGQRVRRYDLAPGQTVACTVSADDDLLIAGLSADLRGATRVDLSFCDPDGVERQRLNDIPVRDGAGGVILNESIAWAKAAPTSSMTARMLAVDAAGGERVIGEYHFEHTRTIHGPPGWEW
jgi:anti-sigma factor RsiW